MKKTVLIVLGLMATGTAQISWSNGHVESERGGMHGAMESKMSKMDTNKDGMLSKEEFLKAHEAMFDRMKGENGMISLKDMAAKHKGMMGHGKMGCPGMMEGSPHHQGGKESSKQ